MGFILIALPFENRKLTAYSVNAPVHVLFPYNQEGNEYIILYYDHFVCCVGVFSADPCSGDYI